MILAPSSLKPRRMARASSPLKRWYRGDDSPYQRAVVGAVSFVRVSLVTWGSPRWEPMPLGSFAHHGPRGAPRDGRVLSRRDPEGETEGRREAAGKAGAGHPRRGPEVSRRD